jgi:cytochrome c
MKTFRFVSPLAACSLAFLALAACSGAPKADEAAEAEPAVAAEPAVEVTFASLTGDAVKGKTVYNQCMACHSIVKGENRVGPSLAGHVGMKAGSVPGYNYSAANKNSGLIWTEEELYKYLEAPQRSIPGTKMSFGGLKKPQDRADVIAYMKTI